MRGMCGRFRGNATAVAAVIKVIQMDALPAHVSASNLIGETRLDVYPPFAQRCQTLFSCVWPDQETGCSELSYCRDAQ